MDPGSGPGADLVSALLNRGKKLQEAMILSTLDVPAPAPGGATIHTASVDSKEILLEDVNSQMETPRSAKRFVRILLTFTDHM